MVTRLLNGGLEGAALENIIGEREWDGTNQKKFRISVRRSYEGSLGNTNVRSMYWNNSTETVDCWTYYPVEGHEYIGSRPVLVGS